MAKPTPIYKPGTTLFAGSIGNGRDDVPVPAHVHTPSSDEDSPLASLASVHASLLQDTHVPQDDVDALMDQLLCQQHIYQGMAREEYIMMKIQPLHERSWVDGRTSLLRDLGEHPVFVAPLAAYSRSHSSRVHNDLFDNIDDWFEAEGCVMFPEYVDQKQFMKAVTHHYQLTEEQSSLMQHHLTLTWNRSWDELLHEVGWRAPQETERLLPTGPFPPREQLDVIQEEIEGLICVARIYEAVDRSNPVAGEWEIGRASMFRELAYQPEITELLAQYCRENAPYRFNDMVEDIEVSFTTNEAHRWEPCIKDVTFVLAHRFHLTASQRETVRVLITDGWCSSLEELIAVSRKINQ